VAADVKILEPDELAARRKGSVSAGPYVSVLQGMRPGQGGEVDVEEGGPSRPSLKNRLKAASGMADVPIQFVRSDATRVLFEIFPAGTVFPKRKGGPGRPKKNPEE